MAILDLGPLAEQRVGLVEQENGSISLGSLEDSLQILLGFTDVFAYDLRQVDAEKVELQVVREHLGGHRLAGAAGAREQRRHSKTATAAGRPPPFLLDL